VNKMEEKARFGPRQVRTTDPDVFTDPNSARIRSRQMGCIGIRRYRTVAGGEAWMPCTNESDYRRRMGVGPQARRDRDKNEREFIRRVVKKKNVDMLSISYKTGNYTKPELRESIKKRIMAGSKGGNPGQWSARKAQLVAAEYRKAGGGYRGGKKKTQASLDKWTKEKWTTSDGKPAIRKGGTRRYLPSKAWGKLTPGERTATNRKKITGSKKGRQFVSNTKKAKKIRKTVSVKSDNKNYSVKVLNETPSEYKALNTEQRRLTSIVRAHNKEMEFQKKPSYTRITVDSAQRIWDKERSRGLKNANQRIREFISVASGNNPKNLKYIADIQMLDNDHPWKKSMKKIRHSLKDS
jgi:hypothetical protein